jgi:hypothetical protein
MKSKYKVVGGSIVGAVAIHVAFVACGHSLGVKGDTDGGTEAGILDALVDHISGLLDGTTKDAVADVDAGGACGCATVSGPIQTTPASENPTQLKLGSFGALTTAGTMIVTGPFVLTDATGGYAGGSALALEPTAAACTALAVNDAPSSLPGYLMTIVSDPGVHGGRYLVPSGQMLCAYQPNSNVGNTGSLQWAGFVPYQ